ncbi:Spy/CpxP family protein refolding chaperone [Hyunsoonleella pacifica]|uniref:Sensor of ECF-type sigma factor n=1 Tax=Hyunsoonleella pacifica TaxID=1080224 RepID=A0A4Q9FMJ1_9FLAO|nr:sensor of ECF-type sigma factor [Hyunsoonleella pacifica]TBN15421.1 sensor of ECF-type sigma factor [Hyunsoonleella pacifica]GGD23950.1 hypothetical protein GCM10011368_27490 [Hyunsoonleella pacifica]
MKQLTTIILVLFCTLSTYAQPRHSERIKSLKIAFITDQLNLTTEEAQKFWPVYNDFEEKTSKIRFEKIRSIRNNIRNNYDSLTDEEAKALIKKMSAAENKLHELRNTYHAKIMDIIPAKKIIKLKIAEEDFKKKMLKELRNRRKEKP